MPPKHQLTNNVKLLQKAAIVRQEAGVSKVLVLQRTADALSRPNCWDLPGGNSEWPTAEQLSAADLHLLDLSREITEETGLAVPNRIFTLDKLVHFSTYFEQNKQVYTIIAGWWLNFIDTDQHEVMLSTEHSRYVWASETELPNYDFGGDKGLFVVDIIKTALAKYK